MGAIMHGRCLSIAAVLFFLAGCEKTPAWDLETAAPPSVERIDNFDPATAGTIAGRVAWSGPVPSVAAFHAPVSAGTEWGSGPRIAWPNPNAPVVDPASGGVCEAVVFLRGVDPRRARPWHHKPVRVELVGYRFQVLQGEAEHRAGFVRRGDTIQVASRQEHFDSLQARGANFFSMALPDAGPMHQRPLDRAGIVELSSGAGHFWMRTYLFVAEHPYLAWTDAAGRFSLSQVPPGDYELVCWHPSWLKADHERDTETAHISAMTFRPAVETMRRVCLDPAGEMVDLDFTLSREVFEK
jgi:hypothetical protein